MAQRPVPAVQPVVIVPARAGSVLGVRAQQPRPARIKNQLMILVRGEGQPAGEIEILLFRQAALVPVFAAQETAPPDLQAQHVAHHRPAGVERRIACIAMVGMLLQRSVDRDRPGPRIGHLARDDIDDTAHRIGTVERRHRATHHLDPLDGGHRRQEALLETGIAIGARLARVLPLSIHQDQRVCARQTADGNVFPPRRPRHRHTLHMAKRVGQVAVNTLFQRLARHHGYARRRIHHALLEAGRRHDQCVKKRDLLVFRLCQRTLHRQGDTAQKSQCKPTGRRNGAAQTGTRRAARNRIEKAISHY